MTTDPRLEAAFLAFEAAADGKTSDIARMAAALAAADAVAPTVDRDALVALLETCGPGVAWEVVADKLLAAGVGGGDVEYEWSARRLDQDWVGDPISREAAIALGTSPDWETVRREVRPWLPVEGGDHDE